MRAWRSIRVLGVLAFFVLTAIVVFGHPSTAGRTGLGLALGGLSTLLVLLGWPATRPPAGQGVPRAPATIRTGRALIGVLWPVRAVIAGLASYTVATQVDDPPGFQVRVAVLAGAARLITLMIRGARRLAGFRRERGSQGLVRLVVNSGLIVLLAGYASALLGFVHAGSDWPVPRWYHLVAGGLTPWLGVPLLILAAIAALFLVALVESVLQRVLVAIVGRDNPVGRFLADNASAWYERTDTAVTFHLRFPVQIDWYDSATFRALHLNIVGFTFDYDDSLRSFGHRAGRAALPMRSAERPLAVDEEIARTDAVFAAMLDRAPADWTELRLTYRAVTGHEEITFAVDPHHPSHADIVDDDNSDDPDDTPADPLITDFPERATLWRLREARYRAGEGAPMELTLLLDRRTTSAWRTSTDPVRVNQWTDLDVEPAWQHRPTREQYRADLVRFPIVASVRPFWLRARVNRFL